MDNKIVKYVAYHGTLREYAHKIKAEGFNKSKKGWLGEGVYFFQEDFEFAKAWAEKKYGRIDVEFIKTIIKLEYEKLFDIVWPLSEQSKYYFKERENYIKEMFERGYEVNVDSRKRYENELINLICKRKGYEAVRACTYTYQKYDDIYKTDSIFANGVEICVRNLNYIIYRGGK